MTKGEELFGSGRTGYSDFHRYLENLAESKPRRIAEAKAAEEARRQQEIAQQRAQEEALQAQQWPTLEEVAAKAVADLAAAEERARQHERVAAVTNAAKATAHFLLEQGAVPDRKIRLARGARRLGQRSVRLWLVNYQDSATDDHHPQPVFESGEPSVTSELAASRAMSLAGKLKNVTVRAYGLGLDASGVLYDIGGSGQADSDGVFKSMTEIAQSRLRLEADPYDSERLASSLSDNSVVYWQRSLAELADSYI